MSGRVIGLGLDALSPVLLRRWTADGTLPNLRDLASRGVTGDVAGVEGFYVGATWPSFWTGRHPGSHGMHYELQLAPGTYDVIRIQGTPEYVRGEPVWEALSRQGSRVAVLDVPLSRLSPAERLNGVQVVDWGGHDKFFGFRTTPPSLGEQILDRYGPHLHRTKCDVTRSDVEEYRELVDDLVAGIEAKVGWTLDLLGGETWDLFLQVFTESHCIGHQAWHLHDPAHPSHDPEMRRALGYDPVQRVYQALDAAVGRLATAADDATLILWSGHGMDFWRGADFLLPEILFRLGVTERPPAPGALRRTAGRIASGLGRRTPEAVAAWIDRLRGHGHEDGTAAEPAPPLRADAAASLCFPVRNGASVGGIRLNLVGREPAGRLHAGAEADDFCARLTEDLLAVKDERTGGRLIRRVVRTDELCDGPRRHQLPDLLLEWSEDVPTGSMVVSGGAAATVRASSPRIGTVEGVNWFGRTGGHRPEGWIVVAGEGVMPGRLDRTLSLLDLAPTMAAMLGARMDDTDGAPSEDLLNSVRGRVAQRDAG